MWEEAVMGLKQTAARCWTAETAFQRDREITNAVNDLDATVYDLTRDYSALYFEVQRLKAMLAEVGVKAIQEEARWYNRWYGRYPLLGVAVLAGVVAGSALVRAVALLF